MRTIRFIPWLHLLIPILLIPDGSAQDLKINEAQYSNRITINDADNDSPDWIEIINISSRSINLRGYQLTDDSTTSIGWKLPNHDLAPDSVILIFASGKNKYSTHEWHTDFKLKLMEEPVILMDWSGRLLDRIDPQCVPPDASLGRWPDGSNVLRILTPTPGTSNNSAEVKEIEYLRDSLWISHPSGSSKQQLTLQLFNKHGPNKIYYTLDGSSPDERSTPYDNSIILKDINLEENRFANLGDPNYKPGNLISKANILRAVVISEGCPASKVISNTYSINASGNMNYPVPVVSIITDPDNLFDEETGIYLKGKHINYAQHGKEWERPVHIEIFDSIGQLVIDQDAGMRIHGGASRGSDQKSLRLYARESYGAEEFKYPFFPQKSSLTSFKTLLLRGSREWSGTLLKDELCHSLVQDLKLDYCATKTSIVLINGEYWGIYNIRERQDKYYVENNYDLENINIDIISYNDKGILLEEGSTKAYDRLIDSLSICDPQDKLFFKKIGDWFDIENLSDFFIAHFYLANTDFPDNNYKTWRIQSDTSKWRYFFFDLDGAMRQTFSNQMSDHIDAVDGYQQYPAHTTYILSRLLQNPDFRDYFHNRFLFLMKETFNPETVVGQINEYQKHYQPLVSEHSYRWDRPEDYRSWISNVEMLRAFAFQRPLTIYDELHNIFGGSISIFPNPSSDLINLRLPWLAEHVTINIFSASGMQVRQDLFTAVDRVSINHKLDQGVYIIQVIFDHQVHSGKLIVCR
ncbi:MAG: hypothetical protein DRJ29_05540 [Bacteroidetes bacterium]|nr:MAG: hypothetical protein DRJ29_05540 [Bacteroidota bacterium]